MKYGSVCSGVEAATVAWHPLGWEPQWFSEIEPFPSAVLAQHYPDTPNFGDMTKFKEWPNDRPIDLLVGGTPCQSFSVAGLRKGLDDPRGNLMLTYLALADRYRPRWLVWENVPGVLSSNGGRDFGTFLGALGQLGYGFSWRILDAQYFGVAQRRRRVFVVGRLGDWRRAAAVLFERESLSGHPAPSREKREDVASYAASSIGSYREGVGTLRANGGDLGGGSENLVAKTLTQGACQRYDFETEDFVVGPRWPAEIASTLNAAFGSKLGLEDQHINGGAPLFVPIAFGAQNSASQGDGVSSEVVATLDKSKTPAVAWSIMPQNSGKDYKARQVDVAQPLMAAGPVGGNQGGDYIQQTTHTLRGEGFDAGEDGTGRGTPIIPAVAFDPNQITSKTNRSQPKPEQMHTLPAKSAAPVLFTPSVRRLTPRECERLQGFPDDYTLIQYRNKPAADGPRYKAMGNSMAVPVMRWIGQQIQMVENMMEEK